MGALIGLLAALAALMFVAWPLLRGTVRQAGADDMSDLLARRDLALDDIRELDFDRALGNLSDEDHQALRDASKRRAVAVLKELNAEEGRIDDEIEQAVSALRRER
ncbi:MAG: hypothetical protein JOZ39_12360 [Chloroflexi bacterium]|nr:hypothetical protein [Chloroflexota bacterium]